MFSRSTFFFPPNKTYGEAIDNDWLGFQPANFLFERRTDQYSQESDRTLD